MERVSIIKDRVEEGRRGGTVQMREKRSLRGAE
jgi:hypothetical protein